MKKSGLKNKRKISSRLYSIKFRMFFSMTVLIAAVVGVCVILNSAFAEQYYMASVKRNLAGSFEKICTFYGNTSLSDDEKATEIEKICNNSNMHVMIFENGNIVYTSLPKDSARFYDGSRRRNERTENGAENGTENNSGSGIQNGLGARMEHMPPPRTGIYDHRENKKSILKETERYKIMSFYIDSLDAYSMELIGNYGEDSRIVIQSSVAAISENISISNSFLVILGFIAVILAAIFGYFISKRVTEPIHGLSLIAKSMADMDFSKKYTGKQADEVGLLGESINTLSEKLERSITELKNANLRLTKDIDQKEKIDRQRREFLSNVSHELKTPIAIIEAYADGLCEMDQEAEKRRSYAEVILDEAQKMGVLIKKLTSLMQLESEYEKVELERYDITEQIRDILNSKKILANQSGAKIKFEETGENLVWADSFLIEEALVNYIVNAIKYGDGKIKVFTETGKTEDKNVVRVNVFNSGDGIADEEKELIWNSFYMTDKARTRKNGSSGLGLSIVKAIAEAHKMSCGVYNADGGVVFYIEVEKA